MATYGGQFTLTINRKPQGIFSKSPATPLQDKTNTVHNEKPLRVRNQTPWRHMTKRQRKNRKRINRLVELWPELFNREKPKPLKVGIPDDLIQDIAIRKLAFGAGTLHAAVASYVQSPRY
ncbi:ProQ/FINO family protein, partial [Escherichia coli]|nr:ProQ/FINO family protein [Escherichia coli]